MLRTLALSLTFAISATTLSAQDIIAPETVGSVKKATVFIRVEGEGWGSSGSGFVVGGDEKAVLIATNDHVAAAKPPTSVSVSTGKPPTITVVFDSGTKTERSYTAQILTTDPERDLAILRVADVKDPPPPIATNDPPKLVETLPVYSFGFPFGKALSQTKGFPSVTVGKASISSLRDGADGELAVVQIDGNLNPGNSGGPVVDTKGRLVGVAVATIKDGQGIGFAVPSHELVRMMQGRIGRVRVVSRKGADGTVVVRIEAELLDPTNNLRTVAAHYFHIAPKAKQPETATLDKHPGSKKLDLKVEKGIAVAEFNMPSPEGTVLIQIAADGMTGKFTAFSRVRSHSLAPPPKLSDLTGTPLPGWKEYSPRDGTFIMWVPEKPEKQTDEERNGTIAGQRMRVNTVVGKTADGLSYQAESVLLPITMSKMPRKDLLEIIRNGLVKDTGGKVTDLKDTISGTMTGAEYTIEAGATLTRARVYTAGSRVYTVQVTGTSDQVAGIEGEILLSSYRLPGAAGKVAGKDTSDAIVPAKPKDPVILGGSFDPAFKELTPEGGFLVGFEVGTAKAFGREMTRSIRPIYRVGDKETFGEQRGTQLQNVTTFKAKAGYAVGGISVMHGLGFDGITITFMKITDGKLDPKDSYESDYIGSNEKKPLTKIGGDGTPIIGIIGKNNNRDLTGFGILLKGQEGYEPPKKK